MLPSLKTLLLLSVLCARTSALCLHLQHADLLCDDSPVLAGGERPSDSWRYLLQADSGESREKRTSSGQPKARAKAVKSERRLKYTLSLDVPTNIMNILFDMAKAKNMRAQAADNARLLAQIGRRK